MKISSVEISNFKSIDNLRVDFTNFNVFVGKNGTGKSSIIRAIDWLIRGYELTSDDVFILGNENPNSRVEVKVHFDELTKAEIDRFEKYGVSGNLIVERAWSPGEFKSTLRGRVPIVKDFEKIRETKSIAEKRKKYLELVESGNFQNLEPYNPKIKKETIAKNLNDWICSHINDNRIKWEFQEEDPKFFGFAGTSILNSGLNYVFLPASQDLDQAFDSNDKQSVLNRIVSDFAKRTVDKSIEKWMEENSVVLEQLESQVKDATKDVLADRSQRIQAILCKYLPNAKFEIRSQLQDWKPKTDAVFTPMLQLGTIERPVTSEGHGVQRATLLAALQALGELSPEKESNSNIEVGENPENDSPLILVVEEPEVYQHPTQVKSLARALERLSAQGYAQVIVVSHSPQFIRPNSIGGVKRVYMIDGRTQVANFDQSLLNDDRLEKNFVKWLRPKLADVFFANAVLVVEGDTELFVFENMTVNDETLNDFAVHIIDAGGAKSIIPILKIVQSIGVPVYAVHDGDTGKGNRGCGNANQVNSWEADVNKFLRAASMLYLMGGLDNFKYGDPGRVGTNIAILDDDLEYELAKWPSLCAEIDDLSGSKKFAGHYGRATRNASEDDCPQSLIDIFNSVKELAQ